MHPIMPFIVGSPRSGTTLLRFALAAHSALAVPPETGFVGHIAADAALAQIGPDELLRLMTTFPPAMSAWSDFGVSEDSLHRAFAALETFRVADGIRCFYRLYAARHGKPRFGDKTPIHGRMIADIGRLLPEAAFIHVIRDGRDASLSLRDMWFTPARDMAALAVYWRDNVSQCREQVAPSNAIWRFATKTFCATWLGSFGGFAPSSTCRSSRRCCSIMRSHLGCLPSTESAARPTAPSSSAINSGSPNNGGW
jgi:hypothetical protein